MRLLWRNDGKHLTGGIQPNPKNRPTSVNLQISTPILQEASYTKVALCWEKPDFNGYSTCLRTLLSVLACSLVGLIPCKLLTSMSMPLQGSPAIQTRGGSDFRGNEIREDARLCHAGAYVQPLESPMSRHQHRAQAGTAAPQNVGVQGVSHHQ